MKYFDKDVQEMYEALGADHLASRIVNAFARRGLRPLTVAVLREQRENVTDWRHLGAVAQKRMDALLEKEGI